MSVQGFTVENSIQKYDFDALEDSPIAKGSGAGSLVVACSDNPNVASGNGSFAGGAGSQATGLCSFAYGSYSVNYPSPVASGAAAFSFGLGTESSGNYSVSLGYLAKAKATASFAIGRTVTANGAYSIVLGKNNIEDTNPADSSGQRKYVFIVGNGTNSEPSNAMTVDWDGNEVLAGKLTLGAGPTANMDAATKQYVDEHSSGSSTISATAIQLLETILSAAVYTSDQSDNIAALIEELSNGGNADNITVSNGVMTIQGLANTPAFSGGVLTIV